MPKGIIKPGQGDSLEFVPDEKKFTARKKLVIRQYSPQRGSGREYSFIQFAGKAKEEDKYNFDHIKGIAWRGKKI